MKKNVVFIYFQNEVSCTEFPTREKAVQFFNDEFESYKEDIEESDDFIADSKKTIEDNKGYAYIEGENGTFCVMKIRTDIEGNGIAVFNEEQMDFSIQDKMSEEEMDNAYSEEICSYEGSDEEGDAFVGTDMNGYEVGVVKIF